MAPIGDIMKTVNETHLWEGELIHETKSGRKVVVASQWVLDPDPSMPPRYLQTNTDIIRRVQMERVVQQTQEDYRLLVETSTEFAMIITDPDGIIVNWNIGAEKIIGTPHHEAIVQSISHIFTPEDRRIGQPWHELEKAKETGRAEDMRWHITRNGNRFWGNGVVMPLWNEDGSLRGFTKIMRDQTADRLVEELGRPYHLEQHEVQSGTSVGIGIYPSDAKDTVELMKRADLALYRAKSAGRGTFHFYTADLLANEEWEQSRERKLREALWNRGFKLYYQPQIDLENWKITTVEALLRWQASDRELILPGDFLDLAEEIGTIVEIGKWVLRNACRQLRQWQEQGMPDLRISVNCSAQEFSNPEFVKTIVPILEETRLTGSFLELEVSEAMLARPESRSRFAELRKLGVRITLDNYGTGTSALTDLTQFEIDSLKIDKTFIQRLPHRHKDTAIASSIINLAHNLGINVAAGGVEIPEQLTYLKSKHCDSTQGFIFSPPLPVEEFEALMLTGHWSRINSSVPSSLLGKRS